MARKKLSEKDLQIGYMCRDARNRARKNNLPLNITTKYLRSIATDECPVFKTVLDWGASGLGFGKAKTNGPQLDRIIPELGYVEGNVAFISRRANRIKDNGTMEEHYAIADWIWDRTHLNKESIAPISAGHSGESEIYPEHRASISAGFGEICNNTDHYSGADGRQDADHSTQASSGDSVGRGSKEVGPLKAPQSVKDNGRPKPKISSIKFGGRHLFS